MTTQREFRLGHMAAGMEKWVCLGLVLVFAGAVCAGCGVEQAKPDREYQDVSVREEATRNETIENDMRDNQSAGNQPLRNPQATNQAFGEDDMDDGGTEEKWRSAPLVEVENPEEENLADWMQQNASGTMVQISTGKITGSGVLWQVSGEMLYIVTARHVVENGSEPIEVCFVDGTTAVVTESWLSGNVDLAFLVVDSSVFRGEQIEQYCLVNTDKESFDELEGGDGIILMASASGVGMDAYEGNLVDSWIYLEDFGQYMMHIHVYAYEGMSGGGVFDQKGYFIGTFCGESGDTDGAAVPLGIIQTEFIRMLEE